MAAEKHLALVAVVASALVTITVTAGTLWHAESRLRAEQAEADRTELRNVLDDAATVLDIVSVRLFQLEKIPDQLDERDFRQLNAELVRLSRIHVRLAIRLGRRAGITKWMTRARARAVDVYDVLEQRRISGSRQQVAIERASDRFAEQFRGFVDAAHRVARSKTG